MPHLRVPHPSSTFTRQAAFITICLILFNACGKSKDNDSDEVKRLKESQKAMRCRGLSPEEEKLLQLVREDEPTNPAAPESAKVIEASKKEVEALIEGGTSPNFRNENCESPLTTASRLGNLEKVKTLLNHGASPDFPGQSGKSSMHFAGERLDLKLLNILLDKNAKLNPKDDSASSPLHRMGALCTSTSPQKLCDYSAFLRIYINAGGDRNAKDEHLQTPLHRMVIERNLEGIRALLKELVDTEATDQEGRLSLHYAVSDIRKGEGAVLSQIVTKLSEYSSHPYQADKHGKNPAVLLGIAWDSANMNTLENQKDIEEVITALGKSHTEVKTYCSSQPEVVKNAQSSLSAKSDGHDDLANALASSVWKATCGYLLN